MPVVDRRGIRVPRIGVGTPVRRGPLGGLPAPRTMMRNCGTPVGIRRDIVMQNRKYTILWVGVVLLLSIFVFSWRVADARLVKITAGPATIIDLPVFGTTGPYVKVSGTYEGEVDPADPHNAVIADIGLAPTVNGKVRYTSTFYLLYPLDLSRGNGKLFYDFGNRGSKRILQWFNDGAATNDPTTAADFGNGFLMRHGYIVAFSGTSPQPRTS
jgi:hypothetical protein